VGYSERQERILDGLEDIFLQGGFRRVTVGDLAARLHCSRRTLYALAPSKQQLFLLVLDRLLRRVRKRGQEANRGTAAVQERIVRGMASGVTEIRKASSIFSADIADFPPARRMLEEHQRERIEDARATIEEGIRDRVIRGVHPRLVAEAVLAAVKRVMDPDLLQEIDLSVGEAVDEVEDLFLHGLLHPRRTTSSRARKKRP
jgi:AcrR family transcriptional regulator